ncbi:hypothetical protein ACFZDK_54365 [Streptomyces sp. NPDC007901]|uniref:hypothetical protein n=1 Tax=Streptomyces sp. NPDC007901 TaxID=3364785 RepID=UPI0036DFBB37
MDETAIRERLGVFLASSGFGEITSTLAQTRAREHSTVWSAELFHNGGDARMEIFVYDLTEDSAGIVDAQEERIALRELDSPLVPRLIAEQTDGELAILAVAAPADAEILHRYLEPQDEGVTLTYQPNVDRLLGANTLRHVDGRSMLSTLMSLRRAQALIPLMQRLADAVGATADEPIVPCFQAAYEVETPEGGIRSFGELPAEYADLILTTTLISPSEPLGATPVLHPTADPVQWATRTFSTVRAGHNLPATFCRALGCCLRGEFITPNGELIDLYFLTAADELATAELRELQIRDLLNAIDVLVEIVTNPTVRAAALRAAIRAYCPEHAHAKLSVLTEDLSHQSLIVLATAMRSM